MVLEPESLKIALSGSTQHRQIWIPWVEEITVEVWELRDQGFFEVSAATPRPENTKRHKEHDINTHMHTDTQTHTHTLTQGSCEQNKLYVEAPKIKIASSRFHKPPVPQSKSGHLGGSKVSASTTQEISNRDSWNKLPAARYEQVVLLG